MVKNGDKDFLAVSFVTVREEVAVEIKFPRYDGICRSDCRDCAKLTSKKRIIKKYRLDRLGN